MRASSPASIILRKSSVEALALARRGARRLSLTLYRADGTSAVIEAGLSAPCHEPSHLARLFEDRVCAIDVGFGVDLMVLAALATEPLLPAQTAFAKSDDRGRQEPLIDRLASRLSGAAVRRLFSRESHIPERAQETRSALAGPLSGPSKDRPSRHVPACSLPSQSLSTCSPRSRKDRPPASPGAASPAAW